METIVAVSGERAVDRVMAVKIALTKYEYHSDKGISTAALTHGLIEGLKRQFDVDDSQLAIFLEEAGCSDVEVIGYFLKSNQLPIDSLRKAGWTVARIACAYGSAWCEINEQSHQTAISVDNNRLIDEMRDDVQLLLQFMAACGRFDSKTAKMICNFTGPLVLACEIFKAGIISPEVFSALTDVMSPAKFSRNAQVIKALRSSGASIDSIVAFMLEGGCSPFCIIEAAGDANQDMRKWLISLTANSVPAHEVIAIAWARIADNGFCASLAGIAGLSASEVISEMTCKERWPIVRALCVVHAMTKTPERAIAAANHDCIREGALRQAILNGICDGGCKKCQSGLCGTDAEKTKWLNVLDEYIAGVVAKMIF